MRDVVIVSGARTAIGRAVKGTLRAVRPDDLAAIAIEGALGRAPGVDPNAIDDVIMGCASPEGEQGLNVARIAALRAGLPHSIPGLTINRFCASGLEAIALGAAKIASGQADVVVAGGTEFMSHVPFMGDTTRPNPYLTENAPDTYLNMGLSVEALARKFDVTREQSDEYALQSHQKALAAQDAGRFDAEIVPVCAPGMDTPLVTDEGPRRSTTLEALAGLRTAFAPDGVITAGNASPLSDGAAAVVLMDSETAARLGLTPLARFVGYAVAAVAPIDFGIAPAYALPKALARAGLTLEDIGLIEFNEAFAAQVLASGKVYPLPAEKVNVNGGAVALGHPLGATGARQTVTLLYEGQRRGIRYGAVSMCAALGMGAAGLYELL